MTLPEDVIGALRAIHGLVQIAPRRFLITVNQKVIKHLPRCELVPFGQDAAVVALEPGRGLSDLALGVVDRLEEPGVDSPERPFWSFGIAWSRCMRS